MLLVPFHIYRGERPCRTHIFTLAATDAARLINRRHVDIVAIHLDRDHIYRSGRTFVGTIAARDTVGHRQAVFLYPYGMADLRRRLNRSVYFDDSASGAYLRTTSTLRTAETAVEVHHRLHEMLEICRRAKHPVGTFGDTQLTGSAMMSHILCAERTGRSQRRNPLRSHLILNLSQSAIYLLFHIGNGRC